METMLRHTAQDEMTCPACNARQSWSDQCRRCNCDLSLLRQFHHAYEAERIGCLQALQRGQPHRGLHHARRFAHLAGPAEAVQLLVVCNLLCDRFPDALAAYRHIFP